MVASSLIKKACQILSGRPSLVATDGDYTEVEFRVGRTENNAFKSDIKESDWDVLFQTFFVGKKAAHTASIDVQFHKRLRSDVLKAMDISPNQYNKIIRGGHKMKQSNKKPSNVKLLKTFITSKKNKTITPEMKNFSSWINDDNKTVEKNLKDIFDSDNTNTITTYTIKRNMENTTVDNIRLSHNLERDVPQDVLYQYKAHMDHYHNARVFRFKNRFSRSVEGWVRIDFTVVRMFTSEPSEQGFTFTNVGNTEYSVELEITNWNALMISDVEMKRRKNILGKLLMQLNSVNFKSDFVFDLKPWDATTLKKSDLYVLKTADYTVTDKADGVRCHMIAYGDKIHFINPNTKKKIIEPVANVNNLPVVVFDGEFLVEHSRFLIFDALIDTDRVNKKYWNDLRSLNLYNRLRRVLLYKDMFKGLKIKKKGKLVDLEIKMKRFYNIRAPTGGHEDIFDVAAKLWENKMKIFDYNLDGLIFTPIYAAYGDRSDKYKLFKWKPDLTIDVRVSYDQRYDFTVFHCLGTKETKARWSPVQLQWWKNQIDPEKWNELRDRGLLDQRKKILPNPMRINNDDKLVEEIMKSKKNLGVRDDYFNNKTKKMNKGYLLGHYGHPDIYAKNLDRMIIPKYDIIEYVYSPIIKNWFPLRFRTLDKPRPNGYRTISNNISAYLDNPTIEDFKQYSGQLHHNNIVDLYNNQNLIAGNIKRNKWRNYNNYCKTIMHEIARDSNEDGDHMHLDLGCGRLGDLNKWINNDYTHVVAVDKSAKNIKEAIVRLVKKGYIRIVDPTTKVCNGYMKKMEDGEKIYVMPIVGDCSAGIFNYDRMFNVDVLKANNEEALTLIQHSKEMLDVLRTRFINADNWRGFDTIGCNFSIHYFFGEKSDDEKVWRPTDLIKNFVENNIKKLLSPNGIVFGSFIDGDKLTQKMDVWSSPNDTIMYSYNKIFVNEGNVNQKNVHPFSWTENFNKIDTMVIYNEVWGGEASEPIITRNHLDKVFKSFQLERSKEHRLVNANFDDFYDLYMKHGRKNVQKDMQDPLSGVEKKENETNEDYAKRLKDIEDERVLKRTALSKTDRSLVNINSTFAYEFKAVEHNVIPTIPEDNALMSIPEQSVAAQINTQPATGIYQRPVVFVSGGMLDQES